MTLSTNNVDMSFLVRLFFEEKYSVFCDTLCRRLRRHIILPQNTAPMNNTHVYIKSHNSDFNNYSVMPLFLLRKIRTDERWRSLCGALVQLVLHVQYKKLVKWMDYLRAYLREMS